jgi:hypothetical protein
MSTKHTPDLAQILEQPSILRIQVVPERGCLADITICGKSKWPAAR